MSDFLFDITEVARTSPIAELCDCGRCHSTRTSEGYRKYAKPVILQEGDKGTILFIGATVAKYSDMLNKPVCDEFVASTLEQLPGYTVYYTPSSICKIIEDGHPSNEKQNAYAKCCQPAIYEIIGKVKPDFIVAFGNSAISALYSNRTDAGCNCHLWRGHIIPDQRIGAWVVCTLPMMSEKKDGEQGVLWRMIKEDLALIKSASSFPQYGDIKDKVEILTENQAIAYLETIPDGSTIALDYETSGLKPDNKGHFIKCCSVCVNTDDFAVCFPYSDKVGISWRKVLANPKIGKVAHNLKMEDRWSRSKVGTVVAGWVWDTCLGAHCINTTSGFSGLKFQSLIMFGIEDYSDDVHKYLTAEDSNTKNKINDCPEKALFTYCGIDSWMCLELYALQVKELSSRINNMGDSFVDGVKFLTNTARAFSIMEENGVKLDSDLMATFTTEIEGKLKDATDIFKKTDLYAKWVNRFGAATALTSDDQLRKLLFDDIGLTPLHFTDNGKPSVDEDSLTDMTLDGLDSFIEVKKFNKIVGTYYAQFKRELSDYGLIHCEMRLNTARSFRSSCTNPNLQNISNRDKDYARYTRSLFLPHENGWQIVEADLKGCEVCGAACHTKDKNLITYVSNPKLDMHRDVGVHLCKCDKALISKDLRSILKMYTFGSFFGSYWKNTAPILWKQFMIHHPKLTDGTPIFDHLASNGVSNLDSFLGVTQDADDYFWNEQFAGFKNWKEAQWDLYLSQGYIDTFTGFRRIGPLSRNQAINTPIQCDSGHLNMWLCQYILAQVKRNGLRVRLFLQIHDSVLAVVHPDDLDAYCNLYHTGIARLRELWKWIIVPLEIEFEVSPVGKSWFEKKGYVPK